MTTLKGKIVFNIYEAKELPDKDTALFNLFGKDVTDPYVVGEIDREGANPFQLLKTKVITNSLTPKWDEKFSTPVDHTSEHITIKVKDKDMAGSDVVGSCKVACDLILQGNEIKAWYQLENRGKKHGKIHMSIQYTPKTKGKNSMRMATDKKMVLKK